MNILIVDDEKEIADLVELVLINEGYNVLKYYNPLEAYSEIQKNKSIDLAIIDVMMPDMNGFELCAEIRKTYMYPIIMLTARVEDIDKITGLSIGADDYVTKPFNPLELLARVKAQLRRYKKYDALSNVTTEFANNSGLVINKDTHTVSLFDETINLTPTEFDILWLLCEKAGNVVSSEEIFETVWKEDYLDSNNTVMVHIRRIREKLKEPSRNPKIIKTVWGVGYKIENKVLKRFITIVSTYTVIFVIALVFLLFVMDSLFNGALLNFLYGVLPLRLFYMMNDNREITFFIIYVLGFAILTINYIFRLNNIINVAGSLITEDDSASLFKTPPEELSDLIQNIKDFKYELKETEHAKQIAEQQKNDLIVYLAHDLKTPLTSVIGYLSLLEETQDLPLEQRAKYVGIALDKAYRLEQLINEFFDITRLNLHTIETYKSKVNVTVLLLQCIDEFFPMFEEKNINIIQDIKPALYINADADKLARVFENLFRNAVNYSYDSTDLLCDAYTANNNIIIRIKNTGDDIPQEKLDRIFDKFYRVDSSRRTTTGGSGLGLAISKEIITLHNGTITASCNDGVTEFKVTLPI